VKAQSMDSSAGRRDFLGIISSSQKALNDLTERE
jgi:hypothetical protein